MLYLHTNNSLKEDFVYFYYLTLFDCYIQLINNNKQFLSEEMCHRQRYLRETAKFAIFNVKNTAQKPSINTSSKIVIPAGKYNILKERHVQWFRIYNHNIQKLNHMKDLLYYQCSPLDYHCKIEAVIQYPIDGIIHTDKFQYGPIELHKSDIKFQQEFAKPVFATAFFQDRNSQPIEFYFDNGVIIKGKLSYSLSTQEISSIHVVLMKQNIISIGSLSQSFFSQKIFNDQFPNKFGPYGIRIGFPNTRIFLNFLYCLNRIKCNRIGNESNVVPNQRPDMSFNVRGTFQKVSNQSTDILNMSGSQEQRRSFTMVTGKNEKRNLQHSELLKGSEIQNINSSKVLSSEKYAHSAQGEKQQNFIDEFYNILKGDDQEEQLCLNSSFEEFDERSKDLKQKEKLVQINKKKEQKKCNDKEKAQLISKIQSMNQQSLRLTAANKRLHNELALIALGEEGGPSCSQLKAMVNSMKRYQAKLYQQLQTLGKNKSQKYANT